MGSRLASATMLYVFVVLGIFLVFAPWTTLWERAIVAWIPAAGPLLLSGWARGCVSGVGVLDLLVALQVAWDIWKRSRDLS